MDKYIGKRLDGRYEVQELVGVGGMAYVYKGVDLLEGRTVAIKILKEEYAENDDFVRRFKNESKAISVLSHKNIVKVYDFCFGNKTPAIIMEYIDGVTLKEYIEKKGALRWKEAIFFVEQILAAVKSAHQSGIVHRDLKPQNIMLLSDGTIKIMDFGIAKFARNEMKTLTDKVIGSVHYISPEQARGEMADEKSDVYSVGVILFEMLTGSLPFEADSPVSVAIKQISSKPLRPTQLNPDIPEGLEEIVLKAMQKNAEYRYQSAEDFLQDIAEFKQNPSIRFEYKYFEDEEPTQYIDAIKTLKKADGTKGTNQKTKKKPLPLIPILSGVALGSLVVAIVFSLGTLMFGWFGGQKSVVTLENFIGKTIDEVKEDERYKDLQFEIIDEVYDEEVEAGRICYQDPEEGRQVVADTTIQVKISKGGQELKIPSLTGMTENDIRRTFTAMGLTNFTFEYQASDTVSEGYAISVSPEEQTPVSIDTPVVVTISLGRDTSNASVPNVIGYTETEARRMIEQKNFKVGTVTRVDNKAPEGTVVSQSPVSGTAPEGTAINLEISTGKYDREMTVSISLPSSITRTVSFEALLDGVQVDSTNLQPSVARSRTVRLTGQGSGRLVIRLDGRVYQEFDIDFEANTASKVVDNSGSFNEDTSSSSGSGSSSSSQG